MTDSSPSPPTVFKEDDPDAEVPDSIRTPGAIQPHGSLLVCSLPDWIVISVSSNSQKILGTPPADLLGRDLSALLSSESLHSLRNSLHHASLMRSVERLSGLEARAGLRLDVTMHLQNDTAILEFEQCTEERHGADVSIGLIKSVLIRLEQAATLKDFLRLAAQQFRAMTGFDRVMIYQFLSDGSGQIVAESLRGGLPPYLGLHFPPSHVTLPARMLYVENRLQQIPDTSYRPVPLEPPKAADGRPFDLSLTSLRSVPPAQAKELRAIGAAAALTVSIIVDGELWGLIWCHHGEAKSLPPVQLAGVELFGQLFSLQLLNKQQAEQREYDADAKAAHDRLAGCMASGSAVLENLERYRPLLDELVAADGVGAWCGGRFVGVGCVPPDAAVERLVEFLSTTDAGQVFATDHLAGHLNQAGDCCDEVSGLLAIPVPKIPRDYLMFFRREVVQSITWAGEAWLSAFATRRETRRGRSIPWTAAELRVAEGLRVALLEAALRQADAPRRGGQENHDRQEFLISELNHRVKNTLAVVRSLVRKSRESASSLDDFTINLEQRIDALSSAHDQLTRRDWSPAPLRDLLEAELEPYFRQGDARVQLDGPPLLLEPHAHSALALVIHELATNAAKYGALKGERGRVSIRWSRDRTGRFHLSWQEAGGPPVRMPERRGFGATVIERTIPYELGGSANIAFESEGLRATLELPADLVSYDLEEEGSAVAAPPLRSLPESLRVLVVEDNMILALDVEEMLLRCGAASVETVSTVDDALRLLDAQGFDAALLDVKLGRGDSLAVAEHATALGIPFAFATGYDERAAIPPRFADIPLIGKPYSEAHLCRVLATLFA